jgi:hypothetical protein
MPASLNLSRTAAGSGSPDLSGSLQPITGREAAAILGLAYPGAFNNARARMERRIAIKGSPGVVVLVVDAWGGVKWPGAEWRYDAEKCRRAARGEL